MSHSFSESRVVFYNNDLLIANLNLRPIYSQNTTMFFLRTENYFLIVSAKEKTEKLPFYGSNLVEKSFKV